LFWKILTITIIIAVFVCFFVRRGERIINGGKKAKRDKKLFL